MPLCNVVGCSRRRSNSAGGDASLQRARQRLDELQAKQEPDLTVVRLFRPCKGCRWSVLV